MENPKHSEIRVLFFEWMIKFHPDKKIKDTKILEIDETKITYGISMYRGRFSIDIYTLYNDMKSIVVLSPNTGKNIKVALHDFEEKLNWDEANLNCKKLGKNWRIPTIEEIIKIDKERQFIGNFNYVFYWTNLEVNTNAAFIYNFRFRKISLSHKKMKIRVRAVMDM
jgi:hypothetical protein